MTIYVCQEMEQNRLPLPQEQDGSGDTSLCGEWGGDCSCLLSLPVSALSVLVTFLQATATSGRKSVMTHSLGAQSMWQMRQVTWHPRQGNREQ